jgi:hypothetical protein
LGKKSEKQKFESKTPYIYGNLVLRNASAAIKEEGKKLHSAREKGSYRGNEFLYWD